jgi:hypothetical protein
LREFANLCIKKQDKQMPGREYEQQNHPDHLTFENINIPQQIGTFTRLPLIKESMVQSGVTGLAHPHGARALNLAFAPLGRKNHELVGLNLLGKRNCIGAVICEERNLEQARDRLDDDPEIDKYLNEGAQVALLTSREFASWTRFYNQVVTSGVWDRVGPKAANFSGLERSSEIQFIRMIDSLWEVLNRANLHFQVHVVTEIARKRKLDLAFLDSEGRRTAIPIAHIRHGRMDGEILVETVISEPVPCPGLVIRQPGENKREAYSRAASLRRYHKNRYGDRPIEIPVVSEGQLSLWSKLGFDSTLDAHLPETHLTAEEVIRFLYLGKDNTYPGELAKRGLSLPGQVTALGDIDIMFFDRGEQGQRIHAAVDDMLSLDLRKLKRGEWGLSTLANVSGIVILPEDWTPQQMKDYAQPSFPNS